MKISVFLGSAYGNDPKFKEEVIRLGEQIGKNNYQLIYGGTNIGLMNDLAESALKNGAVVTGVITHELQERGIAHNRLKDLQNGLLILVNSMEERKQVMIDQADCFVVFPGGLGTIEELMSVWVLKKLNLSPQPVFLLNINDIFKEFLVGIKCLKDKGFITSEQLDSVTVVNTLDELMCKIKEMVGPTATLSDHSNSMFSRRSFT
jgi:uncharacterized protein (TIGR00730 family)